MYSPKSVPHLPITREYRRTRRERSRPRWSSLTRHSREVLLIRLAHWQKPLQWLLRLYDRTALVLYGTFYLFIINRCLSWKPINRPLYRWHHYSHHEPLRCRKINQSLLLVRPHKSRTTGVRKRGIILRSIRKIRGWSYHPQNVDRLQLQRKAKRYLSISS